MIVEGATEERFVNEVLAVHLHQCQVDTHATLISTRRSGARRHKGGLSRFTRLESDLQRRLREDRDPDARFTTMLDLYGYPADAPGYAQAIDLDPHLRVKHLEREMANCFQDPRLIPYIQLHEFETLLFSDLYSWTAQFPELSSNISALAKSVSGFGDIEAIDGSPDTAPSKRILQHIQSYDKVAHGTQLAMRIGLPNIRSRCSHFNEWIEKLEALRIER